MNINLTPLENKIVCEYDIKKGKDDEDDYLNQIIINSFEEAKRKYPIEGTNNEDEIKENCELYLNNKKIDFCYKYQFPKDGKYKIQIIIKNPLSNTNYMFFDCNKLTSLNLLNFNTNNIEDMSHMFCKCSSLTSLNLSNFNTNNVTNMNFMFLLVNKEKCKLICEDGKILKEFN